MRQRVSSFRFPVVLLFIHVTRFLFLASQLYADDKESGAIDEKMAIYATLKTVDGGNVTFQQREKNFQSRTKNMDRLVRAGERQHLHTLALTVGSSIHQDQSIVHLLATPLMRNVRLYPSHHIRISTNCMHQFIETVIGISPDDFLGLARAYVWCVNFFIRCSFV